MLSETTYQKVILFLRAHGEATAEDLAPILNKNVDKVPAFLNNMFHKNLVSREKKKRIGRRTCFHYQLKDGNRDTQAQSIAD